jgi:hypothetical protein
VTAELQGRVICEQFGALWVTRAPLEYRDDLRRVVVPEGHVHDFASIPRPLWSVLPPTDPTYAAAAIVHDWLYASWQYERADADAVLYYAARALGSSRARAWCLWVGVRLGGGWAYMSGPERQTQLRADFDAYQARINGTDGGGR